MKDFIVCEPRGTYNATMCPVCGCTDTQVVDSFAESDWLREDTVCDNCGTEYAVTWYVGTISIEKRGTLVTDNEMINETAEEDEQYMTVEVSTRSSGHWYTYEEEIKPSELEMHIKVIESGEMMTCRIYTDFTDEEYIRIGDNYYEVSNITGYMIDDIWVYSLDTYDEVIQYVKDIFGSDYVNYDVESIAKEMFKKVETDGHVEWHLIDIYRDRDGYGTDATWELAQEYDKDYEYVIKYTRDVLMDEAPGLKPWQYDKLAALLEQNWKFSMHNDIQDLLFLVKE